MAQAPKKDDKAKPKSRVQFGSKHRIIEPKGNHTATIIWCHGLGDTGMGWQPPMQEIAAKYPYIRIVLPTAPTMRITMNGGMAMPGWHDIESLSDLMKNKFAYKEDSKILLTDLIDSERLLLQKNLGKQNKIDKIETITCDNRILLGGFSQGGAMSIYCGLCYDACKLAGIISLSGYLCDFNLFNQFSKKQFPNINILMYHGKNDMIVQTGFGKMSFQYLQNVCNLKNVEWKEADVPQWMNVGHGTTQEEMSDVTKYIGKWLPKQFDLFEKKDDQADKTKEQKNDK